MQLKGLVIADPERKHLPNLQYWVRISAALLVDKEKAKQFSEQIGKL